MKVLAIHNYHRRGSASGDDQVFDLETSLLEAKGNVVLRYTVSNDSFDNAGIFGKLMTACRMLWSRRNYKAVQRLIDKEKPDVVHVHTFFPLLSPSILYAAKRKNVPVIATLHDTRFVCPCATSLRGNRLCNKCGDGHYFRMCKYNCFKGSKLQSFIVAFIFLYHRKRRSFYDQIDKYICLNDNQIRLLENIGFDKNKISKKYNFVVDTLNDSKTELPENIPDRYVVFYGRIGEEKGIRFLIRAWNNLDIPLVVMGGGPLEESFKKWAGHKKNVYFLGYTEHDKCLRIVKGAEFVVFPSIWYEGCSMVEIESMSLKKGIVATNLGFSKEAIRDGYNGYKFPLGKTDEFVSIVKELWNDPEKCKLLGENARSEYEQKYTPDDNYNKLMDCYNEVMKHQKV
ncbi:MAG: glycosyltransferase family 4 protein [Eubacterium sp.]|nr:glycosyltransferase family 4 protein [Eubacterium sp.]